jgi:predicted ATPase/DNA-binding SARP family transcriptional activator
VQIGVLGNLEVLDGARPIEISGARLRQLLIVLALDSPHPVSAAALVEALWGDEPPADQANSLQSLVSRLRRALGDADLVKQSPAGYRLAAEPDDIDVHRFMQLARAGHDTLRAGNPADAQQILTEAMGLWRGSPVEAAESGHADALLAQLEEAHLDAQADLIEAHLALGAFHHVIGQLEGLVAAYPLRERFSVLLMQALTAAGRSSEALASYERTKETLADELGVDPSPELKAAHLAILQGESAVEPAAPARRRSNLRATLTSFVGRDDQVAQISSLMATGRLVTLVGPGGAGKTRLAGAVALELAADELASVWLVELAPVNEAADVPQTVLASLGLRDTVLIDRAAGTAPRDATTRLIDSLNGRPAVLVLDNCEHLIDAAAHLTDHLLAQCPDLRVLATSREPLGIFGETTVVVPPLGQPDVEATAAEAMGFPAVQLFADRAADVQPGFVVDDANVACVIQIVQRLDGLPLAIELAAARLRSLPIQEVERRLSDRFRLLTGGSRTAMPRHRTLRAVVAWSWDLLSASERLLAERLAVFSGGITAGAAAAVWRADGLGGEVTDADIDDLLASLVDKSLLQTTTSHDATPRYRTLETIREFGLERMTERGEVSQVRLAHAEWFAALVAEADPHLRRAEQLTWMAILETERDNILAAVRFLSDDGRAEAAIDLVTTLGWYWMTIGSHGEIVMWVTVALGAEGTVPPAKRLTAEALLAINHVAWNTHASPSDVEAGMVYLSDVADRLVDPPTDAPKILTLLAPVVAMFTERTEPLPQLLTHALAHDDPWIVAAVRTFRASMAENDGNVVAMRADTESSLATFRELGERWGMANSLQVLGQLELMEGNLEAAAAAYQEGIGHAAAIGGREDVAMMRVRLADILTRLGDSDGALTQAELAREDAVLSSSPLEALFIDLVDVEIARSSGRTTAARELRTDVVNKLRELPSAHPMQSHGLAMVLCTAAKLDLADDDLEAAYVNLVESYELAVRSKDMPILASVGVGVAMLAAAGGELEMAAALLGAAAQVRGAQDATQPDIVGLTETLGNLRSGPHSTSYAAAETLPRAEAIAALDPNRLRRD